MVLNYLINQTGSIGVILQAGTENLTGTFAATLFLIFMLLIAVTIMFRVPLEITAIIMLPLTISIAAYEGSFLIVIIAMLAFLSMMLAKNWLFK